MGFNLSLSWFLVLMSFVIMVYLAWRSPPATPAPNFPRLFYIGMALYFLSILVSGFVTMHASAGAH
jgi:hypothetical protein